MNDFFDKYGFYSNGIKNVTPKEAFKLTKKGAILLDVREEYLYAFKSFKVERSIKIPLSKLDSEILKLSTSDHLICADSVGLSSSEAYHLLLANGFTLIANMAGGLVEWERDGLPVEIDTSERLSGSCICQLKPREKK